MIRFLNPENISNATLYDLVSNRFAVADLYLKLANISPDIASDELKRTGKFKALTGNDRIRAEKKNRDAFHFRSHAKLTFLTNQLPKTPDETRAFFRRWLIITCPNTFIGDQCDPNILDKLTTPEELSGLFNWAIKGLIRLMKNGTFTKSNTAEEIQIEYELLSNPVKAFTENCIEFDGETATSKDDAYYAYRQFCRIRGYTSKLKPTLGKELKPQFPAMIEGKRDIRGKGKREHSWIGIRLNCTQPHPGCQGCQNTHTYTVPNKKPTLETYTPGIAKCP
jgi:putative DNA primase/helicase